MRVELIFFALALTTVALLWHRHHAVFHYEDYGTSATVTTIIATNTHTSSTREVTRMVTRPPMQPTQCSVQARAVRCNNDDLLALNLAPVRVYDSFVYNGENYTLRAHMGTLAGHVDRFIVIEGRESFSGRPKPYYLDEATAARADVLHVKLPPVPPPVDTTRAAAWRREGRARDALISSDARVLESLGADDQDWVLITDADEVVRPEVVDYLKRAGRALAGPIVHINLRFCYYAYYWESVEYEWHVRAVKVGYLRAMSNVRARTQPRARIHSGQAPHDVGTIRGTNDPALVTLRIMGVGGWHCSWCMPIPEMLRKSQSYSHTEHNRPHLFTREAIERAVHEGRDLLQRPHNTYRKTCPDEAPYYVMRKASEGDAFYRSLVADRSACRHP